MDHILRLMKEQGERSIESGKRLTSCRFMHDHATGEEKAVYITSTPDQSDNALLRVWSGIKGGK